MTGEMPRAEIDHINCVRDDNRFDNLREASPSENQHNSRTPVTNTSGHKCIYWAAARGKWQAAIKTNNVSVFIGRFDRIEDAVAAVAEARARLHKDFGRAA